MIAIKALKEHNENKGIKEEKYKETEIDRQMDDKITQMLNYYNGIDNVERIETPTTKKYARQLWLKKIKNGLGVTSIFAFHIGGLILMKTLSKLISPEI